MKKLIVIFIILVGTVFAIYEYVARGIYSQNGEFLDGENTDLKHPLGTLTKLMTALVVYDKVEEGKISFETQVRVLTSDLIVDGSINNLKSNPCNNFYFNDGKEEVLKISKEEDGWKIIFNKDKFPQYSSDDFVKSFINIVENSLLKNK